jgi:copper transport protein
VVVDTEPQRGAHLERAPAEVTLRFNEPVKARAGDLRVYDSGSERVDTGEVDQPAPDEAVVTVREGIARDAYTTTYRVVSADGHPVSGGFVFGYGRALAADTRTPDVADLLDEERSAAVDVVYAVARALHYLALLLTLGAVAFTALVVPRRSDPARAPIRVLVLGAAVGLVCSVAGVGLQGALSAGAPIDRSFAWDTIEVSIDNRVGLAWVARTLAWGAILACFVLALRWPRALWPRVLWPVGLAALAIVVSLPLAGHARTQDPSVVLVPADVVHLLGASAWLGGLALLVLVYWPRRAGARDTNVGWLATQRFSRLALPAMAALVAGGTIQAVVYLSSPGDLVSEGYGRLVLAKILLLLAILGLAYGNRRAVARSAPEGSRRQLRRAMRAEVGLALAVVAVAAVLVRTAPPEEASAGPPTPVLDLGPLRLEMSIEPGSTGTNAAHLYFFDRRTGAQVDTIDRLRLELTPPEGRPRSVTVPRKSFAHYQLDRLALPEAGTWTVRVLVAAGERRHEGRAEIEVE